MNEFLVMAAKGIPNLGSCWILFIIHHSLPVIIFWAPLASITSLYLMLIHFCGPVLNELFSILREVFHGANVLNFDEVRIINFLKEYAFGVMSKIFSPAISPEDFFPIYFSKISIVLCFTFKSMIHFWVHFSQGLG